MHLKFLFWPSPKTHRKEESTIGRNGWMKNEKQPHDYRKKQSSTGHVGAVDVMSHWCSIGLMAPTIMYLVENVDDCAHTKREVAPTNVSECVCVKRVSTRTYIPELYYIWTKPSRKRTTIRDNVGCRVF